MKRSILIIALISITAFAFGQGNHGSPGDTSKVSNSTPLTITFTKQQAVEVLKGLQASYTAAPQSEVISAKQAGQVIQIDGYLMQLIYQKWPDLVPKKQ